jgi:hypothetical protein
MPTTREKATESPWFLVKGKNLLVREVSFRLLLLALLNGPRTDQQVPLEMRTHTYLQYTSEMRTHTCVLRKKCSSTFFPVSVVVQTETVFSFLQGRQRTAETVFGFRRCTDRSGEFGREQRKRFSVSERSFKNLDKCEMHVKVPPNAFIAVFVRALDKQTPLSL